MSYLANVCLGQIFPQTDQCSQLIDIDVWILFYQSLCVCVCWGGKYRHCEIIEKNHMK